MADQPLLDGQQPHHRLKDMRVYVIQFPNFEDQNNKDLDEKITYREARKRFFKVFKTTRKIQRPTEQELKDIVKINEKEKQAIPQRVRDQVPWLYGTEHDDHNISLRDFLKDAISSILFTIQYELNLHYSLLLSRDKDEVFCEIWASERWLSLKAQSIGYRLQFRPNPDDLTSEQLTQYPFKKVSPFAKFEIPKIFASNPHEAKKLFKHYDDEEKETMGKGSLFTYNDRVRLIRNSLNTRLDLNAMKENDVSVEDFCLHSEKPLNELKAEWANFGSLFGGQPLNKIRNYFGEKAALYFSWMEMYKNFMIPAGVLGLIIQILLFLKYFEVTSEGRISQAGQVFFALFLAFWGMCFDQLWRRREKILAWEWGTTEFYEEEEQRGEFRGALQKDPVTGKMKRSQSNFTLYKLKNFLSYSVILVIVVAVIAIVWGIMILRWSLKQAISENRLVLAGLLNAIQIRVLNLAYDKVATWLNDWENHETETIYNDKLAIKIFLFRFFNSYSSLFYLAYYCDESRDLYVNKSCMDFLGIQLAVIFFVSILLNIIEILVPFLLMKRRLVSENMKIDDLAEKDSSIRKNMFAVEKESKKESYESPLSDYIEMIIEFGYVVLFGTALPILPLLLLIEIVFEIRVDAWKLCNLMKRADPHRSEDIGVFKDIIMVMVYAGATNNSALIIFTSGAVSSFFSNLEISDNLSHELLAFIFLEHFLFIGMFIISVLIPDEPDFVLKGLEWSDRIIQDKLYNASNTYKVNVAKDLIEKTIENMKNNDDFDHFKLKADEISYRE